MSNLTDTTNLLLIIGLAFLYYQLLNVISLVEILAKNSVLQSTLLMIHDKRIKKLEERLNDKEVI
jgi:hypothetical protein